MFRQMQAIVKSSNLASRTKGTIARRSPVQGSEIRDEEEEALAQEALQGVTPRGL